MYIVTTTHTTMRLDLAVLNDFRKIKLQYCARLGVQVSDNDFMAVVLKNMEKKHGKAEKTA